MTLCGKYCVLFHQWELVAYLLILSKLEPFSWWYRGSYLHTCGWIVECSPKNDKFPFKSWLLTQLTNIFYCIDFTLMSFTLCFFYFLLFTLCFYFRISYHIVCAYVICFFRIWGPLFLFFFIPNFAWTASLKLLVHQDALTFA